MDSNWKKLANFSKFLSVSRKKSPMFIVYSLELVMFLSQSTKPILTVASWALKADC